MAWKFGKSPEVEGYERISADRLTVGMEIWLHCPWYKHPFHKNRFALISAKQIEVIQQLGLNDLYYLPSQTAPVPKPSRPSSTPQAMKGGHAPLVESAAHMPPVRQPAQLSHRQVELRQANIAYKDTLRKSFDCLRQICAVQGASAREANGLVQHFVDELLNSDTSGVLADILHLNVTERVQAAHALNTCLLALLVGRELELDPEDLRMVGLASLLHDIGEQRLPSQIRWKTEPLTRPEKSLFELHPLYGKEILHGLPGVPNIVADIVAQHHENLNGTGYPRRLTDEQILPLAKIIRVVDEYQYLTNPREAQHPRLQPNQALAELYVKRPQHLSMKVIIALVRVVSVYPPGTLVELSDGSLAIVLNTSSNESLRPTVMAYDRRHTDFDTRLIDLNEQRHLSISRIVMTSELPSDLAERITPEDALNHLLLPSLSGADSNGKPKATARSVAKE